MELIEDEPKSKQDKYSKLLNLLDDYSFLPNNFEQRIQTEYLYKFELTIQSNLLQEYNLSGILHFKISKFKKIKNQIIFKSNYQNEELEEVVNKFLEDLIEKNKNLFDMTKETIKLLNEYTIDDDLKINKNNYKLNSNLYSQEGHETKLESLPLSLFLILFFFKFFFIILFFIQIIHGKVLDIFKKKIFFLMENQRKFFLKNFLMIIFF